MRDNSDARPRGGSLTGGRTVWLEADVLAKNDRLAAANRGWFSRSNLLALNLVSSPGAGKTTLLERTLRDLAGAWPWAVVEGDQRTDNDPIAGSTAALRAGAIVAVTGLGGFHLACDAA